MPESSLPSGARSRDLVPLFFLAAIVTHSAKERLTKPTRLDTGLMSSVAPNPPDFGPANPPKDSVEAGQTVRIVKDILPVGRWKTGFDATGRPEFWNVTPGELNVIERDFHDAKSRNVRFNLGFTHGNDDLLIHPNDIISRIEDVKVFGDRLWLSAYVSPDEAQRLKNPAMRVSVGVVPNWTDGTGKTLAIALVHVAVTDRPVVNDQGPFRILADRLGGSAMDIVAAVNLLLEALGKQAFPDDTTPENVIDRIVGLASALGTTEPEAEPETATAPEGEEDMDMSNLAGLPAQMADKLKPIFVAYDAKLKAMSDELAARKANEAKAERSAFDQKVGQLLAAGVTRVKLDTQIKLANELKSYDLRLLDPLEPTLNTGNRSVARKLADANPVVPGGTEPSAEERRKTIAKEIASRRGISEEAALKFVPVI